MRQLPRGTVTLLFTDIEGSTRLLQELGRERYVDALTIHRELLRNAFTRHGGVEVEMQGDSFHFSFQMAREAVRAAAAGQRALAGYEWPSEPIRVRIGLHTGEPVVADDLYAGLDVHRAARVMSAAHGGQVLLSSRTADLIADEPPEGLALRDLGAHRLKDLLEPQKLYQLVGEGLGLEFPPPKSLENRPTNLPVQPTPLVGRERELQQVLELLERADVRLLTLTGPGGTGKTRLALQAAAELIEAYPNGVFFVNLAALTDPELVVPAIAQPLGVKEQPGESIEPTLAQNVREQELLLLLDNFEQVLDAAAAIARLLKAAPGLNVVVTSRSSLRLQAEHEYAVPPLAGEEAVRLFAERARAAKATFSLNGNRPLVAEICRRLDGLPLAIELAAARIKLLPEAALLARLDDKLKLLTGGARDLDERQRTLRAAIDWSYELLTKEEQTLFRRLAVFAGGRSLDAIEAICNADGQLDVLEGVASLVDKSLLRQEETGADEPRFIMLETIHEYAREKLEESGEAEELGRRHADWFLAVAQDAESRYYAVGQAALFASLEAEHDNFRASVDWFQERRMIEPELELATALHDFWIARGHLAEGRSRLESALHGRVDVAPSLRAKALDATAWLATHQLDYAAAERFCRESLGLARTIDDDRGITSALALQGTLEVRQGRFERARELFDEALQRARAAEDGVWTSHLLGNLADLELYEGAFDDVERHASECLEIARSAGDTWTVAVSLLNLGHASLHRGRVDDAASHLERALELGQEIGADYVVGAALDAVAALIAVASPVDAARLMGGAEEALRSTGSGLAPFEAGVHERTLRLLEQRLGPAELERFLQEGRESEPEDTVALGRKLVRRGSADR